MLGAVAMEIMGAWENYEIVRQVRGIGLLLGVSFGGKNDIYEDAENWWIARAVRGEMLERGVWAISDHEDTIRLYPALNMEERTLIEGLQIMEKAIQQVERGTEMEGDRLPYPTGVAGF